jgi:hypothetical protein
MAHFLLRKIFGPKVDESGEHFRLLQNVKHGDLCGSLGVVRVIKSVSLINGMRIMSGGGRAVIDFNHCIRS